MVILTSPTGNELKSLQHTKFDVDLNETRDFELRMPANLYTKDIQEKGRLFIPQTEYGGLIGGVETQTATDEIIIKGRSWRGILSKKVIKPPEGSAYKIVSGELNKILKALIDEHGLSGLFTVPQTDTKTTVISFQFDRYTTLLEGIEKLLKSVEHRIDVKYMQQERGLPGFVNLQAVKIADLSERIELSQDSRLDFTFAEVKNGVNHLICLGQGELTDRVVVDLYMSKDGTVGTTQHYFGIDEVTEVYEDTSAENIETLIERGTQRLTELTAKQTFTMNLANLSVEADIRDIIGGRDYITGMSMAKPIVNKIYTEENGVVKIEYKLEGAEGG